MRRIVLIVAMTTGLSGCGAAPQLAGADGASIMASDKTIIDHVISFTTGKNCSTLRAMRDLTYCEEDEVNPHPVLYCYRDLGKVSCYSRPDAEGRVSRVGENDQNLIRKR